MKASTGLYLASAVGTGFFVQTAAADESAATDQRAEKAEIKQESLLTDDTLSVRLRYYDWNNASGNKVDAGAIAAEYNSGYYKGIIGHDIAGSFSSDVFSGTSDDNNGGNLGPGGNNIGKLTKLYIKAKYDELGLKGGLGITQRSYNTFSDSGSRIQESATKGVDLSWSNDRTTAYGSYITSSSPRNSQDYSHLTAAGKDVELSIIGGSYTINGFTLEAEYSETTDTLARGFAKVAYSTAINDDLTVGGDVRLNTLHPKSNYDDYVQEQSGVSQKDVDDAQKEFDEGKDVVVPVKTTADMVNTDTSKLVNVNINATYKMVSVNLGYTKTTGNDFNMYSFDNDHGTVSASTYNWDNFGYEGEEAVMLGVDIDASLLASGLYFGGAYTQSVADADAYEDFNQKDFTYWAGYDFGELNKALEGLTVTYTGAVYRFRGTSADDYIDATATNYDDNPNRIRLEYVRAIF